jgi:hypothetical protein
MDLDVREAPYRELRVLIRSLGRWAIVGKDSEWLTDGDLELGASAEANSEGSTPEAVVVPGFSDLALSRRAHATELWNFGLV